MSALPGGLGRSVDWRLPLGLLLLSLVPAMAGLARLDELVRGAEITEANERFFAMPLPVTLHIISVIPYSMVGALQLVSAARRRAPQWHRTVGCVLVVAGLIAGLTGLWMTLFYPWPAGDGRLLYVLRLVFGSAMVISILVAMEAIRRRDFASHGRWMIRAYAIGMGAATQVLTHLPWFVFMGRPVGLSRAALMGAGWVINLIFAEWVIRRGQAVGHAR